MKGKGYSPALGNRSGREDPPASTFTKKALARAYENALRMLDRDAQILDQLRSRASLLIAALAIGVSVLAASLSKRHLQPALLWLLGSAIVLCLGVLWPVRDHGDFTVPVPVREKSTKTAPTPVTTPTREMLMPLTVLSPRLSAQPATSLSLSRGETAGHRRAAGPLADAWRNFTKPWKEWIQCLGQKQRLWKTGLGKDDLAAVPTHAYSSKDTVDQVLLGRMYLAHTRNDGTLSRRADLLRLASLLALAFVIDLGFWLR